MAEEGEVKNAQRRLFRLTYTPLAVGDADADANGHLLIQAAYTRLVGLTESEAGQLEAERRVRGVDNRVGDALPVIRQLTSAAPEAEYLRGVRKLGQVDSSSLAAAADAIADLRKAKAGEVRRRITDLDRAFGEARHADAGDDLSAAPEEPPAAQKPDLPPKNKKKPRRSSDNPSEPTFLDTRVLTDAAAPAAAVGEPNPVKAAMSFHPLVIQTLGTSVVDRLPDTLLWAQVHRPD